MKSDKILLNISNIEDLNKYKKLGISNFLFPLKDYSIGYPCFSFDEIKDIKENIYVLANRILTDDDIDNFLTLKIPDNVKGFIIEDIGLYEELKDKKYELINFQNHLNNNYETINYWLKYFDSLIISTDITKEEIELIIKKAKKPLILNTFGYPMIMYSRRRLISNFYKYMDLPCKNELYINETLSSSNFFMSETEYGTAVFNNMCIDYRKLIPNIDEKNIKFYLVNTAYTSFYTIKKVILGVKINNTTTGFLDKKTVYRVGDIK